MTEHVDIKGKSILPGSRIAVSFMGAIRIGTVDFILPSYPHDWIKLQWETGLTKASRIEYRQQRVLVL